MVRYIGWSVIVAWGMLAFLPEALHASFPAWETLNRTGIPLAMTDEPETIYEPLSGFDAIIRAQSPSTYDLGPQTGQPGISGSPYFGGATPPNGAVYGNPYGPSTTPGYDPFLNSPNAGMQPAPYGQAPYGMVYDINGPQPARLGWSTRWDFLYQAPSDMNGGGGDVSTFGIDLAGDYTFQGVNGWMWTLTPEFNYREYNFDGSANPMLQPIGPGDQGIADNYYRFAYRFQTTTPSRGPVSWRFGFTPALATDFSKSPNSHAWNLDADVTMFYRTQPNWMWVLGVLYWDRAEDFIVPHVGAVWNPNPFWEIRAVYPNPRADVFVGTPFGIATWLYAGAEYSVESFHAGELDASRTDQLQIEEWRAFAGIRWEASYWSSYLDFGYAFDRKWNIHSGLGTSDLAPQDAFMVRYGIRY